MSGPSLAEELAALIANPSSGSPLRCSVGLILRAVDDATRGAIEGALASEHLQGTQIAALLNKEHRTSAMAVQRHRRRQCRCETSP